MTVALRPARPGDAGAIAEIYAPHVSAGIVSFETEPPDAAAMHARMMASDGLYPWVVAAPHADRSDVLAFAYAARFRDREAYRWCVETTIYVAPAAQGHGVGRQLYRALLATLQAQGFTQAIGTIALPNAPSVALHEAVGFERAGLFRGVGHKLGHWIDVGYWQCALAEPASQPGEPLRFTDTGIVLE